MGVSVFRAVGGGQNSPNSKNQHRAENKTTLSLMQTKHKKLYKAVNSDSQDVFRVIRWETQLSLVFCLVPGSKTEMSGLPEPPP